MNVAGRGRIETRTGATVPELQGPARVGDVIADLNPLLHPWGNYFRTGNAAVKFRQADRYVAWRLKRLLIKKRGRNLRARRLSGRRSGCTGWACTSSGTIRYPKAA